MDAITTLLNAAVKAAFPDLEYTPTVTPATNTKYGDYQTAAAREIFFRHKTNISSAAKSPIDIANLIIQHIPENSILSYTDAASNGYINFFLSPSYILTQIQTPFSYPHLTKHVIVDFSSPNICKNLHVGHLRSTVIGDAICRILEFCGHTVERINHIGDWGTQFGMLIAYLKEQYPNTTEFAISDLQKFYKAAKVRFDSDEEFAAQSKQEVVLLQSGNLNSRQLWERLCAISMQSFQEIYNRLNVHLTTQGESFYNDRIPPLIEQLQTANLIQEHNGAQVFPIPDHDHPLVVRKNDGAFCYDSTDLAAIQYRLVERNADWVIYVVDVSQSEHFVRLFKAAEMAGWSNGKQLTHVAFGMVLGPDGKRFKTRSGETIKLVDLLDEAVVRAEQIRREKGHNEDLSSDEAHDIDKAVGYGSVKYFDLHANCLTNYTFSYDRMLDFKGNTGVYLLYAHARICSILRKAAITSGSVLTLDPKTKEMLLARILSRFSEVICTVAGNLHIHELCEYLYELANAVSVFHRECRVIGDPREQPRLILLSEAMRVMRTGLGLLGIEAPDKI